jgi:hypothetical protein
VAPSIAELGKPNGERCQHLCGEAGASCSIYNRRPPVCVDFFCLWRASDRVLPDWLRPADCGFMLAFNNPTTWPSVVTVHPDPARPEAWRNPWAMTVFATLAEQWNCLVAVGGSPDTTDLFCPNGRRIILDELAPNARAMLARDDGWVGAPSEFFGPDRRPLVERLGEVDFKWDLPAPPWAR